MGAFDDYFASTAAEPVAEEAPSEFSKSLRAGVYGARSQLQSAAGLAGEALGFDQFAKNRNADAKELQAHAEENAPRIGSYKQVLDAPDFSTGLRNAGDYVTGLVGSSLPIMGAGIAGSLIGGRGGALRGMLGATAATAPFEIGDIAQKQAADPVAAAQPVATRAFNAGVGGLASAGVQSLVPGLVGQQLMGKAAGSVGKQSLRSIVGHNALDIPMEGFTEAGGEAVKQYASNQDKPFDVEALKESFVGGAAAGGAFAGVGTAADVAHSRAGAIGDAARGATSFIGNKARDAATSINDVASNIVDRTGQAAETVQTEAPKKFKSVSDEISDLFQQGKDKSSGVIDKILNGEALVDARQFATETGQAFSDNEKVKAATEWTSQMANDAGLTPERRQQATEMAQSATTEAGQMAAAAAKKTYDAGMTAAVKINRLYDSVADKVNEQVDLFRAGRASNDVKQSADFSGTNKAIADQLGPLISKNPGLADRPGDVTKLADTLREVVPKIPGLDLNSNTAFHLIDMLGDQTVSTLDKAFEAVSKDAPATTREAFYNKVMALKDMQERSSSLKDLIGNSLTDEAKQSLQPSQYGELARALISHARGEYDKSVGGPTAGPSQRAALDYQFRQSMQEHFGDKADAISLAVEKEAKLRTQAEKIPDAEPTGGVRREAEDLDGGDYANGSMGPAFNAETGERLEPGQIDSARFGLTKPDAAGKSKSKLDGAAMPENSQYARQHLLDLQKEYASPEGEAPKYNVRFEKLPDSNMGHIVVERNGAASEGEFGIGDLERIKLDTHKHGDSPSRIDVNNLKIDAVKVAQLAGKLEGFGFESADTLPSIHRTVDMFKRGIAQLSDQFGKNIDVPDSTVIGYSGKRVDTPDGKKYVKSPITWGEAQKLSRATADDRATDRNAQYLTDLRKQYIQATASPEKLAKLGLEQKKLSSGEMEALIKAAQDHAKGTDYVKARELAGESSGSPRAAAMKRLEAAHERHLDNIENKGVPRDKIKTTTDMGDRPFEERNGNFDEEGNLTRAGAVDLLTGESRYEIGKDEQIGRVASTLNEKDMISRANMDGSGQFVSNKPSGKNLKPIIGIANELKAGEFPTVASIQIGKRLSVLIKNRGLMRESDVAKLQTITTTMSAGEIGKIIDPLVEKYQNVIVKSDSVMAEGGAKPADKGAVAPDTGRATGPDPDAVRRLGLSNESKAEVQRRMGKDGEGTPDPKSQAAKKAALLEAASSSDPALIKELSTTSDAAALQRTVAELPPGKAADAANERMSALVQDPDTAMNLTKKFSMDGTRIHEELGNEGFGATHDSPTRHEGVFDWRSHQGKGEGNAAFGAGTYLSTAEGVHKSYKGQFTAKMREEVLGALQGADYFIDPEKVVTAAYKAEVLAKIDANIADTKRQLADPDIDPRQADNLDTALDWVENLRDEVEALPLGKALLSDNAKSPTYEVSVNIKPEQLLDWNKPLSEQSERVQEAMGETLWYLERAEGAYGRNYDYDVSEMRNGDLNGAGIYNALVTRTGSQTKASEYLQSLGILGHKYNASAGKNDAHPNYVIYDDSKIKTNYVHFSMDSTRIHKELGRDGFAATHDSPIKHEGKFDWRAKALKGMGVTSEGAGTYLSSGEITSGVYKTIFTDESGATSPTYSVSVDIPAQQLMDLDAKLKDQPEFVKQALSDANINAALKRIPGGSRIERVGGWLGGATGADIYARLARGFAEVDRLSWDDAQAKTSELLQAAGILGSTYDAEVDGDPGNKNYVIYDDSKIKTNYVHFDKSESGSNKTDTAAVRAKAEALITELLADSVKLKFADLTHAGEFERMRLHDIIRLSTTALDPLSTLHHEALHAFFAQLKDAGAHDITNVLEKAAGSENVIRQLNERYAGNDAVLAQLKDPEERAAYMYQHWAAGDLKIGPQAKGVFTRIADYIRSVMGIWTNDQRASMILEHFNTGEYANSGRDVSVMKQNIMEKGRNQALEAAKSFAEPLTRLAEAVVATGSGRLRDTGIPSIVRLADIIKRDATDGRGGDRGFIPAARIEATKRLGALGRELGGYDKDTLHEAMEALQRGRKYSGANGADVRKAQEVIKATLKETREYMVRAGAEINDLGPDYFPRVWDSHYISKNQQAFRDMMEPYIRRGEYKGNADDLIRDLAARDGNEFGVDRDKLNFDEVETRPPGMQFSKKRVLDFIKPEDAAMFVSKDLMGTLSSYITQSTRKAEWTRRLGNGQLQELVDQAIAEGATPEQLKTVDTYLRGVDGTLGDKINPHARRIAGNMIVYQNIRLLPFAAFSSVVDPMGVLVRGATVRDAWDTFKRGMASIPETFGRQAKTDRATEIAELVGVIDSAVLTDTLGDIYTQNMVGGFAKKANNLFFKYNLMEGFNRSFRVGASEAAMSFIAKHADGTASDHSKRWINELGLEAGDITRTADGRIALTTSEGLSLEQERRVHAAINQWVDGAVLRPDAADKPIWMNDPHYALVSHLKQFVYSFQKTILARVVHEAQNGNFTPAMALASYVPMMMAADFIKGMVQGGGEQPEWKKGWDMIDYTSYAGQRAGLLGVGQFGADIAKDVHQGGIGIGALTGPTIEQFFDAVQLLGGHKQFGPMVLNALPANALYKNAFGSTQPDLVLEK